MECVSAGVGVAAEPGATRDRIRTSLATPCPPGGDQSGGEAPLPIGYCLRRCQRAPPKSGSKGSDPGGVPERPKGADCKSAGSAFPGSNPGAATLGKTPSDLRKRRSEGVSSCRASLFEVSVQCPDCSGSSQMMSGADRRVSPRLPPQEVLRRPTRSGRATECPAGPRPSWGHTGEERAYQLRTAAVGLGFDGVAPGMPPRADEPAGTVGRRRTALVGLRATERCPPRSRNRCG